MNKFDFYSNAFSIPCQKIFKDGLRTRANFALWLDKDDFDYAMFIEGVKTTRFSRAFLDDKIKDFMPKLKANLLPDFKEKLFEIRFFASNKTLSVVLLYHKDVNQLDLAKQHQILASLLDCKLKLTVQARKQRFSYPDDILEHISGDIKYIFNDECFIQPSLFMNEKMLDFAKKAVLEDERLDLLELYCGYGNFTLALAPLFRNVFATELSKKNVDFLRQNCELNNIQNVKIARLKDSEVLSAINKEREFNRLKDVEISLFEFKHVLVDPPRVGLGECVHLVKRFDNIIYISCNPKTAKDDLKILEQTHKLTRFCMFDQFVNSEHIECGFYLKKR